MTQATVEGNVYNYQYDPAGNIKAMSVYGGVYNNFSYDADNRISSINTDSTAVSYDDNGNLLKLILNGTTRYYSYDSANRLTAVGTTSGASDIASYTYDGNGNRLSKTVGSTTTTYHYFQGQLMYETANGTITAAYLRSSDGKLLGVRLYQGGVNNYYYYHYDAQGNVSAVTNSSGVVYRQYVYDPYGNIISVKDASGTPVDITNDTGFNNAYTYRGYRYDSESGLYFLNARYYSAGIGRFLTKDSIGILSDPQSLNRYTYCEGDPVNLTDPSGLTVFIDANGDFVDTEVVDSDSQLIANMGGNSVWVSISPTGEPNSVGKEYGKDGNLTKERWYGPDGRAVKDKHYTDHGNPKQHPKVPHEHDWGYNEKGNWEPGKAYMSPTLAKAIVYVYIGISAYNTQRNKILNGISANADEFAAGMAAGLGAAGAGGYVLVP